MVDARTVARLAEETLDGDGVRPHAFSEDLDGTGAALGMLRPVDGGRATLTDALHQPVAGDGASGEILLWHRWAKVSERIEGRQVKTR